MPVADGSAGLPAPPPQPKSRGGGGRRPPETASAPAPSSPAPASAPAAPAPAAPAPTGRQAELIAATMPGLDMSPEPKTVPPRQDILQLLTNPVLAPQPTYTPGGVAKAESHLALAKGEADGTPLPLVNSYGMRTSDPDEAHASSYEGTVQDAKQELADAERGRRRRALRSGNRGEEGHADVERMSQEEYDALSDRERAAIDFNTMLVGSTRRDKRHQDTYSPDKKERGRYDNLVKQMFGEDGGSMKYAPETVALLDQIGFKDQASDLDDFLGLRAAITDKDIRKMGSLGSPTAEASMNEVQLDRLDLTQTLTKQTDQMQSTLVKGNQMLATMGQTAAAGRSEHVDLLGGDARDPNLGLGFGTPQFAADGSPDNLDTYFQIMYDKLADAKGTRRGEFQTGIDALHSDLSSSELSAFMKYADTRSGNASDYGIDLGDSSQVNYRSPQEFRKLLGLDGGQAPRATKPEPEPKREPAQQPQQALPPVLQGSSY